MPKRTQPTPEQLAWLRNAVEHNLSFKTMAAYMAVCVDTLKRILARHELMEFDGAKYAIAPAVVMWTRPCSLCGCTQPRPKNHYRCAPCKEDQAAALSNYDPW